MRSLCTCTKDKEATCMVHPTTRSLKAYIAQLEAELEAEIMDTTDYEYCTAKDIGRMEVAATYWQETALAHRQVLRGILADTPHQHIKTMISTHLKQTEGDTDE